MKSSPGSRSSSDFEWLAVSLKPPYPMPGEGNQADVPHERAEGTIPPIFDIRERPNIKGDIVIILCNTKYIVKWNLRAGATESAITFRRDERKV